MSFMVGCGVGAVAGLLFGWATSVGVIEGLEECNHELRKKNAEYQYMLLRLGQDHYDPAEEMDYHDFACMAGSLTPESRN